MKEDKEDRDKECFHLWCQYLKESKDYKRLCKWIRKGWIKDTSWIEEPQVEEIEGKLIIQPSEPYVSSKRPLPKKLEKKLDMKRIYKLLSVYGKWKDIHNDSFPFDKWYELYKKSLKKSPLVQDYIPILEEEINQFNSLASYAKEPLMAFKECALEFIKSDPCNLYLQIDLTSGTEKELIDKVRELIKERKGNLEIDNGEDDELRIRYLDKKKRELTVYRLYKYENKSYKEIGKEIYPIHEDPERAVKRDMKNAQETIKKVEMGLPLCFKRKKGGDN